MKKKTNDTTLHSKLEQTPEASRAECIQIHDPSKTNKQRTHAKNANWYDTSLYIHWPYCLNKCPYCGFNSHRNTGEIDQEQWTDAYLTEIRHYAKRIKNRNLVSIYFGGGTPSMMNPHSVAKIIEEATKHWSPAKDIEITLETNAKGPFVEKFAPFKDAGINRLSLGVQSLRQEKLKFLGRGHKVEDALKAIEKGAETFDHFSFDMIYALPGQTLEEWKEDLEQIIPLAKGHLSLYQLTIDRGTAFYDRRKAEEFVMPDEETSAELYEETCEIMDKAGLYTYEISNYAAPGHESIHNLAYWRYQEYIGIGPGAHGRIVIEDKKKATGNYEDPEKWLKKIEQNGYGTEIEDDLHNEERASEALLMGIRLSEGIPFERIEKELDRSWNELIPQAKLDNLYREGYLIKDKTRLIASLTGRTRLNSLIAYLLG